MSDKTPLELADELDTIAQELPDESTVGTSIWLTGKDGKTLSQVAATIRELVEERDAWKDAADAAIERDRLTANALKNAQRDPWRQLRADVRPDTARAEVERVTAQRDVNCEQLNRMIDHCKRAEAERDALRDVLEKRQAAGHSIGCPGIKYTKGAAEMRHCRCDFAEAAALLERGK